MILYTTGDATLQYATIGVDQMGLTACGLTGVHIRYIIKYYDSSGGGGYSGCRFAGQVYMYTAQVVGIHHEVGAVIASRLLRVYNINLITLRRNNSNRQRYDTTTVAQWL